jgi:voltage-gated potassium channel
MRQLGARNLLHQIFRNRAGTAVYLVAFLIILVLEFGSLAVLAVEHGVPGSNIETAGDALWWTIVTIATVGYGDLYPVTGTGRLLGIFVITLGVALFGVVTGFLANRFVEPANKSTEDSVAGQEAIDLEFLMSEVKALRREQARSYSELEAQLEGLKALLKDPNANN